MDYNLNKLKPKQQKKKQNQSVTPEEITPTTLAGATATSLATRGEAHNNSINTKTRHKHEMDHDTFNVTLDNGLKNGNYKNNHASPISINRTLTTMTDGEMKLSIGNKSHSVGLSLQRPKDVSYSPDTTQTMQVKYIHRYTVQHIVALYLLWFFIF